MLSSRFSLRAICGGFLADIVASQVLVFALTLVLAAKAFGAAPQAASSAQMTQVLNNLQSAPSFLVPATALGLLGSIIGGYVAAFSSTRDDAWRNALVAGSISLGWSVFLTLQPSNAPLWIVCIGLALSLPATMLGAFLCVSARSENSAEEESANRHDDV